MDPTPELNLIEASERSSVTKRYIPAIWSAVVFSKELAKNTPLEILANRFELVKETLGKTGLEWAAVYPGLFLDYFVPSFPSYVHMIGIFVDVLHNAAAIPGTGTVPITLTHTRDVGLYMAALLGKPEGTWKNKYLIAGDQRTWNEVVALAEKGKGVKFKVVYDGLEKLERGECTELPSHLAMSESYGGGEVAKRMVTAWMSRYGVWMEEGAFWYKEGPLLNEEFPKIESLKLDEAWKKVAGSV